ncbi:MAG: nucleoid-associated protein [Salibacteraceae bacterium]|nr:nucleoid-associated protein [Salibacteraceae bacterium]
MAVEEEELLTDFFFKPFKTDELFAFRHHDDVTQNIVYTALADQFRAPVQFIEASKTIAEHLYHHSIWSGINGGEFFMVYFDGILFNEEPVEVIGMFKSERKTKSFNVHDREDRFDITFHSGINMSKPDKACLVFKTEDEDGYRVLMHDHITKGEEAKYWRNDFLGLGVVVNEYSLTKNYMNMCKNFVMEQIPEEFEVDRTLQIELMNRSAEYFTQNEKVDSDDYSRTVFEQPQLVESFNNFKEQYAQESNIELEDHFTCSPAAVKKQKKMFKSILKLDKNFHIYVHGNNELIENGFDEKRGMKFYKVFYNYEV